MYKLIFKRLIDVVFSFLGLLFLFPLLLVLVVLLKIRQGSVFFMQRRPGINGKIFNIIKFKTMNDKRDANGQLLPDEYRITKIGRFIRSYSLDEIPQLYNVLIGDMSLIGPRPLLEKYLKLYTPQQARRHEVKPGVTGWAQVNGRNAISWEKKFELDVWYVDNVSFRLDFKIILLTIKKVIRRSGISSATDATMETFTGTHNKE